MRLHSGPNPSGIHIHPLSLGLGMAFLLESPHGLFLVDAGSPGQESKVLREMNRLGRSDLRLIWITHAHYDHYGSAAALRRLTGAPIAVHALDATYLSQGQSPFGVTHRHGFLLRWLHPFINALWPLRPTAPDATLEDGASLEKFGLNARVLHTPGHTPGHACLALEGGIVFAGDLVAWHGKAKAQELLATDWTQIPTSIQRLKALHPQWVYTGHQSQPFAGAELDIIPDLLSGVAAADSLQTQPRRRECNP